MTFTQPNKYCPTCGKLIPSNGYMRDEDGEMVFDSEGQPIHYILGRLICKTCAINAAPPFPKRKRRDRNEDFGQLTIPPGTIYVV